MVGNEILLLMNIFLLIIFIIFIIITISFFNFIITLVPLRWWTTIIFLFLFLLFLLLRWCHSGGGQREYSYSYSYYFYYYAGATQVVDNNNILILTTIFIITLVPLRWWTTRSPSRSQSTTRSCRCSTRARPCTAKFTHTGAGLLHLRRSSPGVLLQHR